MKKHLPVLASPVLFWFISTVPASAYIGPGTGLGALGSILSFIGVVFLVLVGFFWYPLKRMVRKVVKPKSPDSKRPSEEP